MQVVEAEGGYNVVVKSYILSTLNDQLRLKLEDMLDVSKNYTIQIHFRGKLADDRLGLYKSSYVDQETQSTRWHIIFIFLPYGRCKDKVRMNEIRPLHCFFFFQMVSSDSVFGNSCSKSLRLFR